LLTRLASPLILAGLVLLFFAPLVVQPDAVLYSDHSDLLAHYLPAKRFLVQSWRETGELPLWCPYSLGGMPFIHDPQVGAFYPLHWPLLLVPLNLLGAALSWSVVLHLWFAGCGTYACAREKGLDRAPAMVAAIGFAFAGKWLLHLLAAGHYTTIGLAWMPWALFCMERATRRLSLSWATGAGVCYALLILSTQPQWAFYAGILLAIWALIPQADCDLRIAVRNPQSPIRYLVPRFALGLCAALVAVSLSAVQWLPTIEAAAYSTRAGGVPSEDVLGGGMRALLFLVGPPLTSEPANLAWEDRGGFGILWLVAAALAPFACTGRVRWQAGACLGLILFAAGGAILVQGLPGFRLFRQPTRMLLIASLPVALLAGSTTRALLRREIDGPRCLRIGARVVAAAAILVVGFAARQLFQGEPLAFHSYWITLVITFPAACWVLKSRGARIGTPDGWQLLPVGLWIGILVLDLWAVTWPLVAVRTESEVYAPSPCAAYLANTRETPHRVLDVDWDDAPSPLGRGTPMAMQHRLEAVRGYNPIDVRRYKEYLQQIAGDDAPLRPFEHPLIFPIIDNFPIENRALLDLLGVRYLLQPSYAPVDQSGWRKVFQDANPAAFDVVAGGRRALVPYSVYENEQAFPRVFVVPRAVQGHDLRDLDLRRTVLLEETPAKSEQVAEPGYWAAAIREYQPNRVVIDATGTTPGWLVLTDVWFPGWTCTVDGAATTVLRGDFVFRTVRLDAGRHKIVFRFEPASYKYGRSITFAGLAVVVTLLLASFVVRTHRRHLITPVTSRTISVP